MHFLESRGRHWYGDSLVKPVFIDKLLCLCIAPRQRQRQRHHFCKSDRLAVIQPPSLYPHGSQEHSGGGVESRMESRRVSCNILPRSRCHKKPRLSVAKDQAEEHFTVETGRQKVERPCISSTWRQSTALCCTRNQREEGKSRAKWSKAGQR